MSLPSSSTTEYMQTFRERQRQAGVRRVSVTLSADEWAALHQHAAEHRERVTTHLKKCAFAHLHARYLVPPDLSERLDVLVATLRGIGNNLNQLARYSNEMRAFLDHEEVRLQLRRLEGEIRAFISEPPPADESSKA